MLSRINFVLVLVLAAVALVLTAGVAQAGTISQVAIPTTGSDANAGFDSTKTYTHAFHVGNGNNATYTINGVTAQHYGHGNSPYWNGTTKAWNGFDRGNPWSLVSSGSDLNNSGRIDPWLDGQFKLWMQSYCGGGAASTITIKLGGLTPGTAYETHVYFRTYWTPLANNGLHTNFTMNGDGTNSLITFYEGDQWGKYIKYNFTALGTQLTMTQVGSAGFSGMYYGFSNYVIPEPSTLALLAAGLVGLLCYAWRKRK